MTRTSIRDLDSATLAERLRASAEGRALATNHPNVLVRGTLEESERIIVALTPYLRQPIQSWVRDQTPATRHGTFIVRGLETLTPRDQAGVLSWLNGDALRVQMVGVTSSALFPLVEGTGFLDALYYRLNTLYIDADDVW